MIEEQTAPPAGAQKSKIMLGWIAAWVIMIAILIWRPQGLFVRKGGR